MPFIAICESWVKPFISDGQLHIDNYSIYRADRESSNNGGVLLYIHNSITIDISSSFDDDVCSVIICLSKSRKCIIASVYRPPGADDQSFANVIEFIQSFIDKHRNNNLNLYSTIIFGDFNFPGITWSDSSFRFPNSSNLSLSAFKSFIIKNFFTQYVNDCTRKCNVLDLFLTDNPAFVDLVRVEDCSYSDHNLIKIYTSFFTTVRDIAPTTKSRGGLGLDFSRFNLNKANWDNINKDLSCLNWNRIIDLPINDFPQNFRDAVFSVLKKHCQIINFDSKKKTFLNKNISKTSRKISKLKNKIKYSDCTVSNRKKSFSAISNLLIRKRQLFLEHMLFQEAKATRKIKWDSKYFFKYVNRHKKVSLNGPRIIIDKEENTVTDAKQIADLFQDQFKSVFSTPFNSNQLCNYSFNFTPVQSSIKFLELTQKDIVDAINEIRSSSSCPKSDIPAIVFKSCKFSLSLPLMLFWRKSFGCGKVPTLYKTQIIIPLHKKGPKTF